MDWAFAAKHPLDVKPDLLRDIQVDVALSNSPCIEVISGWDHRFDRMIYEKYEHDRYVRAWVPMILIWDKSGHVNEDWFKHARWERKIVPRKEDEVGEHIALELQVEDLRTKINDPLLEPEVIGTIEAGYSYPNAEITPEQAIALAEKVSQHTLKIRKSLLPYVFETIAEGARDIVNADSASVLFSFNPDRNCYVYKVSVGKFNRRHLKENPPRREGLGQKAIKAKQPKFIPDHTQGHDKDYLQEFNSKAFEQGTRAMAAFPLLVDQKQGVLYIGFNDTHWFTEDEIGWVKLFAGRAVDAIRHATHYKETHDSANRLANLHAVTESIVIVGDTEMCYLLQRIAGNTLNLLTADLVTIYEYIGTKNQFPLPPIIMGRLRVSREMKSPTDKQSPPVWLVENQNTLHKRSVLYAEHVQENRILCKSDGKNERGEKNFVMRESIESAAGVLLKSGNEIVGVMFINYRRHHMFSDDEKNIIEMLASTAAIAIQNRRLLDKRQQELEKRQQELMDIAHQLEGPLNSVIGSLSFISRELEASQPFEEICQYLKEVEDLVEDALALSTGIFTALAREAGRETYLSPDEINVTTGLREFCERLRLTNDRSDLEFKYPQSEYDNTLDLSTLQMKRTAFISVMYSLIHNAMKYAERNSLVVFKLDLDPLTKVQVLKVRSVGEPIQPQERERIFEKFQRGEIIEKTGRYHSGVGLGLWVARELMRGIGGNLTVDLFPDQPRVSEFVVHFPGTGQ